MANYSVIMEMVPGEVQTRLVDSIEADDIDHAWKVARAKWYNSPLEEQNRKIIMVPSGSAEGTMVQKSVTPQIVDVKEGEYALPEPEPVQAIIQEEPAQTPVEEQEA